MRQGNLAELSFQSQGELAGILMKKKELKALQLQITELDRALDDFNVALRFDPRIVGLFRVEVTLSGGTGKLKLAGGVNGVTKESFSRAFAYLAETGVYATSSAAHAST